MQNYFSKILLSLIELAIVFNANAHLNPTPTKKSELSPELFKVLPRERDYKTEHIIFELTEYGQLVALNYLL